MPLFLSPYCRSYTLKIKSICSLFGIENWNYHTKWFIIKMINHKKLSCTWFIFLEVSNLRFKMLQNCNWLSSQWIIKFHSYRSHIFYIKKCNIVFLCNNIFNDAFIKFLIYLLSKWQIINFICHIIHVTRQHPRRCWITWRRLYCILDVGKIIN